MNVLFVEKDIWCLKSCLVIRASRAGPYSGKDYDQEVMQHQRSELAFLLFRTGRRKPLNILGCAKTVSFNCVLA